MMGKLIKYEMRSAFKRLGVLWLAAFAMLVVNAFLLNYFIIEEEYLDIIMDKMPLVGVMMVTLPIMLVVITCIAVVLMPFIYIVARFGKGLLGDEGYLMFTLPVKTRELVLSKAITAFVVQTISSLVASVPIFVIGALHPKGMADFFSEFFTIYSEMGVNPVVYTVIVSLTAIVAVIETIFRLYLCMSLGHLAKKHRVAWSVGAYVGLNYAVGAISACVQLMSTCGYIYNQMNSDTIRFPMGSLVSGLCCYIVFVVVEYILVNHILKKRLNLE